MERFLDSFKEDAIKYHNIKLYFFKDAIKLITECERQSIKILGLDSFKLTAQGIQPSMEFSYDYSALEMKQSWDKAKEDLTALAYSEFLFEFTY